MGARWIGALFRWCRVAQPPGAGVAPFQGLRIICYGSPGAMPQAGIGCSFGASRGGVWGDGGVVWVGCVVPFQGLGIFCYGAPGAMPQAGIGCSFGASGEGGWGG